MIPAHKTNKVYLSDQLVHNPRYRVECNKITDILDRHAIGYDYIFHTKTIWCRDYLPVQITRDQFVQFQHHPSYLVAHPHLLTSVANTDLPGNIYPSRSSIILDGSHIVHYMDQVLITNRVFQDNPDRKPQALLEELSSILHARITVIPRINYDLTGHASRYVRFLDRSTLIGYDLKTSYRYWTKGMKNILDEYGLHYINMPYFRHSDKHYKHNVIGQYMNYLEVDHLIIFPIFEVPGNKDHEAMALMEVLYPDRILEPVVLPNISLDGIGLNQLCWGVWEYI